MWSRRRLIWWCWSDVHFCFSQQDFSLHFEMMERDMTYNVFGGTLNLAQLLSRWNHGQHITQPACLLASIYNARRTCLWRCEVGRRWIVCIKIRTWCIRWMCLLIKLSALPFVPGFCYLSCTLIKILLIKYSSCVAFVAIDLVSKLLQVTMRKRYTVDKSLAHIWLQVNSAVIIVMILMIWTLALGELPKCSD